MAAAVAALDEAEGQGWSREVSARLNRLRAWQRDAPTRYGGRSRDLGRQKEQKVAEAEEDHFG